MSRTVCLIRDPDQGKAFSGLILPDVFPRLEEPPVFLVGAVEGRRPVGAAVLELEPGRAQLLSISVAEDCRRRGIGTALLRQCVRVLRRTSVQTLYGVLAEEEEAAEHLLRAFGMETPGTPGAHYSFEAKAVARIAALRGAHPGVFPLNMASNIHFRSYLRKAFPADPSAGSRTNFDPQISQVLVENGLITACLLAEKEPDGFSLGWFSSFSRDKWALLYLLRGAVEASPPDARIHFAAYDPAVIQLADKMLGGAAEKMTIREWALAGGRFRLTDTTPTGWEEDDSHEYES